MRDFEERIYIFLGIVMVVFLIPMVFFVCRDIRDRAQFHRKAMEGPNESVRGDAFRFAQAYCGTDPWNHLGVSRTNTVYTYTWSCGARAFECVLDQAGQSEGCRLVFVVR